MVHAKLEFQCKPKYQKVGYREVQRSVTLLFDILEEYARLTKQKN